MYCVAYVPVTCILRPDFPDSAFCSRLPHSSLTLTGTRVHTVRSEKRALTNAIPTRVRLEYFNNRRNVLIAQRKSQIIINTFRVAVYASFVSPRRNDLVTGKRVTYDSGKTINISGGTKSPFASRGPTLACQ